MRDLFFALFFFIIKSIQAFSQIGFEIKDLQEIEYSLFQKEAEHWKVFFGGRRFETLIFNNSEGKLILGDPNVLKLCDHPERADIIFERIYTGLPPHKSVTFTGKFWYFDGESEKSKSEILVFLSSGPTIPLMFSELKPEIHSQTEDQVHAVKLGYLHARQNHQSPELYLTIRLWKNEGNEKLNSLGIREITIHLNDDDLTKIYGEYYCMRSQDAPNLRNHVCSCAFGETLNEDSVCQSCSPNCLNCFTSDPGQCVQCSQGMSWRGHECNGCHRNCKSCTGPGSDECLGCNGGVYDYGNGTCLEACEWPFKKDETKDGQKLCVHYCKSNEYLWRYASPMVSCLASCSIPLVPLIDNNGLLICHNPCVDERDFLYANRSCIATCPVPLVATFDLGARFCKTPCESTSDYLYANRSCLKQCPAPLQIRSEPVANFCVNPCHSKNRYLYQNGSCLPSCPFPGKIKEEFGVKYCLPPCRITGEYILADGSCSSECPVPLIRRAVVSMGTFCQNPCKTADHFISRNGSCLLTCPDYFEIKRESGMKYCLSPCGDGQYYFEKNKLCLEGCPFPFLKAKSEEGINLCKSPCSKLEDFIYDDQLCHESCPLPLVIEEGNYCKSPCLKENEYVNKDGSCQKICEYPETVIKKGSYKICMIDEKIYQVTQMSGVRKTTEISHSLSEIGGMLDCLINPGDPTSILMMPLLKMFEQITMILPVNISVGKQLMSARLPENIDENLRALGIICLIYFLLIGIRTLLKESIRSQVSRLVDSIWGIFALVMMNMNGHALLYIFLIDEFKWNEILICLTVILFTTFVGYKIILIKRTMSQEFSLRLDVSNYPEKWRFLFEIYQSDGPFMLIYILRITIVSFVIGCLSESPEIQTIIILLMNIGMLLYLILGSPIAKKISYFQHVIIETGLLLYNGVFVILAVFDLKDDGLRNSLGQFMIILYFVSSLLTAIIVLLKLLLNIYHLLFKTRGGLQADHIQLRELSQSSEEEGESDERLEHQQQGRVANEIGFREINQQGTERNLIFLGSDSEDDSIEADVVVE